MILRQGAGMRPKPGDRVRVLYRGTLLDGTEFDSTADGQPRTFPLSQVIAGWSEGLSMMPVGGKYRFWIPGDARPTAPRACPTATSARTRRSCSMSNCSASNDPIRFFRFPFACFPFSDFQERPTMKLSPRHALVLTAAAAAVFAAGCKPPEKTDANAPASASTGPPPRARRSPAFPPRRTT